MINAFSIDYMHCILLGIMKKLITYWITSKRCHSYRLSNNQISIINSNINLIISQIPSCFSRKPRSINTFRQWKATEFRLFLLYTGKFVLKNVLSKKYYEHFLTLSHAVSLVISSRTITPLNICIANKLFHYFIKQGIELYGRSFPVYNVHLLSHLGDDVLRNGALDNFSSFPYENYLGNLKKMIRGGRCPLKQVINTIISRIQLGIFKTPTKLRVNTKFPNNIYIYNNSIVEILPNDLSEIDFDIYYRCRVYKRIKPIYSIRVLIDEQVIKISSKYINCYSAKLNSTINYIEKSKLLIRGMLFKLSDHLIFTTILNHTD